jgi:lytic murein transglycosylase
VQSAPAGPAHEALPPSQPPADRSFEGWRAAFIDKAVARGFNRGFVTAQLADVAPNPRIVASDGRQPEFAKPVSDYIRSAVSDARVAEGLRRRDSVARLPEIQAKYGTPSEILVSIWGQESGFGKVQGDYDVISAFATLAHDGRRRAWAEEQLLAALTILRDRGIPRAKLKGSWAGAMGQTQFIPEGYLRLGQDADGDGVVDIWGSDADALASAANHLAKDGWIRGGSWAVEVLVPEGFDWSVAETEKLTPERWTARGLKRADGRSWTGPDVTSEAVLLAPAGAGGPAFLAFPNHFVIRKYNNSLSYALSIGLMADAMRGEKLVRAWPQETPLSLDQRMGAQRALKRLGYLNGEIDGVIGAGSRAALRAWQKANGLVADGYLTPDLAARLAAAQQ